MDSFVNKRTEFNLLLGSLANQPEVIAITEVNSKRIVEGLRESDYELFSANLSEKKSQRGTDICR
jgi:hypothetical protein